MMLGHNINLRLYTPAHVYFLCLSDMKLEHNINLEFVYTCSCVLLVFMKLGHNINLSLYTPAHVYFLC